MKWTTCLFSHTASSNHSLSIAYKPSAISIEKILNILMTNNVKIKDIITSEPSLEDLFNNLVK